MERSVPQCLSLWLLASPLCVFSEGRWRRAPSGWRLVVSFGRVPAAASENRRKKRITHHHAEHTVWKTVSNHDELLTTPRPCSENIREMDEIWTGIVHNPGKKIGSSWRTLTGSDIIVCKDCRVVKNQCEPHKSVTQGAIMSTVLNHIMTRDILLSHEPTNTQESP